VRATPRRIALATLLVAFLCSLALLPSAHADGRAPAGHAHSAAVIHLQTQVLHRTAEPDLTAAANAPDVASPAPDTTQRPVKTDTSHTVDSARTRGPPVQADHQPALSL